MVNKMISVLTALNQAGIRAKRGTLNDKVILPASPVAVVYPEKSEPERITVAVEVFGTKAVICEDMAYEAVAVLNDLRASCTVDSCHYSGKTGLFSVKILARWNAGFAQRVFLDDVELTCLEGLSITGTSEIYQSEDGTTLQTEWVWVLTMEELLPGRKAPEENGSGTHPVRVITAGGTEVYGNGRWISASRKADSRGPWQTRVLKCYQRTTE